MTMRELVVGAITQMTLIAISAWGFMVLAGMLAADLPIPAISYGTSFTLVAAVTILFIPSRRT